MITVSTGALVLLSTMYFLSAIFLAAQCAAALFPHRRARHVLGDRCPRLAVVIPAHNESLMIQKTIDSVKAHLPWGGRLLVVADNCTDGTADVALAAGAEVAVRSDADRKGKGYALDHGLRLLAVEPPEVVIFIDADCEIESATIEGLAKSCFAAQRPVQARYVMQPSNQIGLFDRISQFAWRVRTFVRPSGAANLGWPCQLMGTGMALPWPAIGGVHLASGHLAEDQKLGADLALTGKLPLFCPDLRVTSRSPATKEAKQTQRTRWEHGHLALIPEYLPRLIAGALRDRSFLLLALAIDLCIPPMSLLLISLILIQSSNLCWLLWADAIAPFLVSSLALLLIVASLALAWWRFGRDVISPRDILLAPAYCVGRLPSLLRYFVHRQVDWIRTDRV
jgi:cellulose synthase/poly-beta-1,6-N-acetylglucosamine synthase-like glycosyltransferase